MLNNALKGIIAQRPPGMMSVKQLPIKLERKIQRPILDKIILSSQAIFAITILIVLITRTRSLVLEDFALLHSKI